MNRSILRFELRQNRTYTIIWCAGVVLSTGANVAGSVNSPGVASSYNVLSLFATSVVNMVMMGSIFSMILGGLIVSREQDEKTIEFLLSHPVTRLQIAVSKIVALVILIVLFCVILLAADFLFLEIFKSPAGYDRSALIGIWISELILIVTFGMAGLFFSSFVTKGGGVVGGGIGIPIVMVLLATLGSVDNTIMRLISYVSPFKYLDVGAIMRRSAPQPGFIIAFLLIAAALLTVFLFLYRKREFAV